MRPRDIHHIGHAVDDIGAAVDTYERLFGAVMEHRETVPAQGVEAVSLRVGSACIELLRPLGAELIDEEPHAGLFGLQVAFIHPSSVAGVLVEYVQVEGAVDG